jgi:hypothetical protein
VKTQYCLKNREVESEQKKRKKEKEKQWEIDMPHSNWLQELKTVGKPR